MIRRISITGPESTGKTTLSKNLADRFHTVFVPEFARNYLDTLSRPYQYGDLVYIAKQQLKLEQKMAGKANLFLFCDTDFIVLKIWSIVKFGRCDPWISDQVILHPYDLYLLTNIDLPWIPDTQREDPDQRNQLLDLYKKELDNISADYHIISGFNKKRLINAVKCITDKYN